MSVLCLTDLNVRLGTVIRQDFETYDWDKGIILVHTLHSILRRFLDEHLPQRDENAQ